MKKCPYKGKNPECFWAKASGCSWSLLVLEFKDNREFDGSPIIQSLSSWKRRQSCVLCFLVFDFNHVNAQTPKCLYHFYHHFLLITLNHLGINETRREKWGLSGGMSIFALSSSFSRKLAILFCLFSSRNLYLSCLSSLYPNPNLSFFWITTIGLSIPCSLFPNLFPARAPFPSTWLMPK